MRSTIMIVAILLATHATAQQPAQTDSTQPSDSVQAPVNGAAPLNSDRSQRLGTQSDTTAHAKNNVVRASEIIGVNVKNNAGEDLGSINDLVIDPSEGRISYAAISMGGFLGVGDKLFAVPWTAVECRKVDDEHVAILDVNKQTMENAQGFDQENWPDMANEQWRTENDRRYKVDPRAQSATSPTRQIREDRSPASSAPAGTQPLQNQNRSSQ